MSLQCLRKPQPHQRLQLQPVTLLENLQSVRLQLALDILDFWPCIKLRANPGRSLGP